MKICFFLGDVTQCGGTEKVACQIANELNKKHYVYIISLNESAEHVFFDLSPSIRHYALFTHAINAKIDYIRIVRAIRQETKDADIVIDVDVMLDAFSVPAIVGRKTKLISWEHFNFYETLGNRFRVAVRKAFTRHSDCVVVLTKEDKNNYVNYFRGKVRVVQIYNPIDIIDAKNEYKLDSKTIISIGRLDRPKGFDMLVEVADLVLSKNPDWNWIILGEGEERSKIEMKIKEKEINNLFLIGQVKNVYEYLYKSSIYVLTSRNEGFPLVLLEAKQAGLPIVAFDCKTGPRELVADGVNGYLIDCFNIDDMASKICELIKDEEKRVNFSSNARINIDEMKIEKVKKQWMELIDNL